MHSSPGHLLIIFPFWRTHQNGVYIIDSPGFGENPSVDKMLLDYITDSDIFAFIYVIKSDNAGGVQDDRVCGTVP